MSTMIRQEHDRLEVFALLSALAFFLLAVCTSCELDPALDLAGKAGAERGATSNDVHHAGVSAEGSLKIGL